MTVASNQSDDYTNTSTLPLGIRFDQGDPLHVAARAMLVNADKIQRLRRLQSNGGIATQWGVWHDLPFTADEQEAMSKLIRGVTEQQVIDAITRCVAELLESNAALAAEVEKLADGPTLTYIKERSKRSTASAPPTPSAPGTPGTSRRSP